MEFYFKLKGGKMHLYRENGIFDDDLGELEERKTFFNQEYQRVTGGYREEGIWR